MSRSEHDREDLMSEATALRCRAAVVVPGETAVVVAGFRDDGRWSVYFGGDPYYQFDPEGRLRRAFVEGRLYRTQGHTLAQLSRTRSPEVTELQRADLSPTELQRVLTTMRARLTILHEALQCRRADVRQSIPPGADLLPELTAAIDRILHADPPLAAAIGTRRR